jgi:hypothetical protein
MANEFDIASMICAAIRDRRECYRRNMELSEKFDIDSPKYNTHITIAKDAMREVAQFEAIKTAYINGALVIGITKDAAIEVTNV